MSCLSLIHNLFSPDLLQRIRDKKQAACTDKDGTAFRLPDGWSVLNEIGKAFSIGRAGWHRYTAAERADNVAWVQTLLRDVLGFTLQSCPAQGIPAEEPTTDEAVPRLYPVTYLAGADEQSVIPVLVVPNGQDLDKTMDQDGLRHPAPFRQMQQLLNESERYLWAIVTNGSVLRLMRDNPALSRPCYLEADLEAMFSTANAPAFDAAWRLLHASRAALSNATDPASCLWEEWHLELEEQGSRARDGLRDGVERALCALGTGFLHANESLREALNAGTLDKDGFYQELMRTVYRLIFLSVMEERGLIHAHIRTRQSAAAEVYNRAYSLSRLVDKALSPDEDERFHDLWQAQLIVFHALGGDEAEEALALPALGGLFAAEQCPHLTQATLPNRFFLLALNHLRWFREAASSAATRVDYRYMGTEELGSVYESLLELTPAVTTDCMGFYLKGGCEDPNKVKGNARKSSGSYYTPSCLVEQVLNTTLAPLLATCTNSAALLRLRVIDPACGSGHFLLGAARRMAETLAALRHNGPYTDQEFRQAMHDVVSRCIYGVDMNPMAVELARMALWLEGYAPGKPLSFLDHHLQSGNSLLGIRETTCLNPGIPSEAYTPQAGDDKDVCKALKKHNSAAVKQRRKGQHPLTLQIPRYASDLEQMPEDTPAQVRKKEQAYKQRIREQEHNLLHLAADIWTGAFLLRKEPGATIPTTTLLEQLSNGLASPEDPAVRAAQEVCRAHSVFHWPLRFPDVLAHGGFHCVLGNPPWEKTKLQEKEFFSEVCPEIAQAPGQKRKNLIALLKEGMMTHHLESTTGEPVRWEQALYQRYEAALHQSGAESQFFHVSAEDGGRFPLTGVGDVNLYALFAELACSLRHTNGRAGIIVPTGIATDDSTKAFFNHIRNLHLLDSLYGFSNKEKLFPDVGSAIAGFCTFTLAPTEQAEFAVHLKHPRELADKRRRFSLTVQDFALLNPNTGTCPLFRCGEDADLCRKMYRHAPILMQEGTEDTPATNPWGIKFNRLLDMTNDSGLFLTEPGEDTLPLYEGKMVHHYDHRWATFANAEKDGKERDTTTEEHADPAYEPTPRYWVRRSDVIAKLPKGIPSPRWMLGFRDITNPTNERTFICSFIPFTAVGNKLPLLLPLNHAISCRLWSCLCANLSALCFDYIVRMKQGGTSMNFHYVKQFPVLPPEAYRAEDEEYISRRVLELVYTSESMRPWAEDMGYKGDPFPWDEDRRAQLRAELDVRIARLYGLTRGELEYILDPSSLYGDDSPTQTFPGLRKKEEQRYGEYRTKRLILSAWDQA